MSETTKPLSDRDYAQTLRGAFNDSDKSFTVNSFIVGKIGHKVVRTNYLTTGDDFSFYDNASLLYTIRINYTDTTKTVLDYIERIA